MSAKTMSAAVGAGKEFTQAIIDHLGGRVARGCNRIHIADSNTLRHEFRMKLGELNKSMRFWTAGTTYVAQKMPLVSDDFGKLMLLQKIATPFSLRETTTGGADYFAHNIRQASADGKSLAQVKKIASHKVLQCIEGSPDGCTIEIDFVSCEEGGCGIDHLLQTSSPRCGDASRRDCLRCPRQCPNTEKNVVAIKNGGGYFIFSGTLQGLSCLPNHACCGCSR